MTIDLDGMKMEYTRVYGKKPYKMDEAIYCKLKEHGIETKKAVELAVKIDSMIRRVYMETNQREKMKGAVND